MTIQGTQQELFEEKTIDEDQTCFKEFLKEVFRAGERIYSHKAVERAFNDWQFEREAEQEIEQQMERDAIEEEVGEGNDF